MANRWTINLHESNTQAVGDVLHQSRFTVTRWRDEKQQSHQVGTFVFADDAHLFRKVRTHHWQVRVVDQLVTHERRQHARLEFVQSEFFASLINDFFFQVDIG